MDFKYFMPMCLSRKTIILFLTTKVLSVCTGNHLIIKGNALMKERLKLLQRLCFMMAVHRAKFVLVW